MEQKALGQDQTDLYDNIDIKVEKTLVVRNDKIGDFMLSWPALALLKAHLLDDEIHVLVPEYTRDLAELCPSVHRVVVDQGPQMGVMTLRSLLRDQRYRLMVTLFSTTRVGLAAWLARIPYRVAPATKIAQIFYNHRLSQRRSQSLRPEYEYNLELTRFALEKIGVPVTLDPGPPYLVFGTKEISELREAFVSMHNIGSQHRLIFVHPGSGGSARNLSLSQYQELITAMCSYRRHWIIISAGPGELENARKLSQRLDGINHVVYESNEGLVEFARHIAFADLFISGSTGPLHIAGALNRPTVGFYSRRRSATALRWQTLNQPERHLAFSPPLQQQEEDMASIDIRAAARKISKVFLNSDFAL